MKFIDWFAGIGGFRRGMEMAGHECVGFCEWDKYAAASYISMHLITDDQRECLAALDIKTRQKEILKERYRNGEWYASDIKSVDAKFIPRADLWCFGAPCQDFSFAGFRAGLDGDRSSLVREIFRLLENTAEENRPEWLLYENVKGMLSANSGHDFLEILNSMDELGYDCEWQNFNTKNFGIPQHRERIYTCGHLRRKGRQQIFPVTGTVGKNRPVRLKKVGILERKRRRDTDGFNGIQSVYSKGVMNNQGTPAVLEVIDTGKQKKISADYVGAITTNSRYRGRSGYGIAIGGIYTGDSPKFNRGILKDCSRTLKGNHADASVVIEAGRKQKQIGSVWYEKEKCYIAIRRLTPRECFRLQGWSDEYFDKAAFVNSDTQLYKQAGNGVTVNVVYEIAKRMTTEKDAPQPDKPDASDGNMDDSMPTLF